MSRLLAAVATWSAILFWLASPAHAGPFGGFSADQGKFLSGQDRVCTPLAIQGAKSQGEPACEQAGTERMASLKFRRGTEQQGVKAEYEATLRGTEITITARRTGQVLVVWSALDPIARITGVYLSEGGGQVAVEYEARAGGRVRTDTIAFLIPGRKSAAAATTPGTSPAATEGTDQGQSQNQGATPGTTAAAVATPPASAQPADPRVAKLLASARNLDKKGKAAPAAAAYGKVLAVDAQHAEARYGLARNLARQGKRAEAVAELRALASAAQPEAIVWVVEARFDRAFAELRADPGFRAATGLDPDPARPRGLYERLLGFSNTWEQSEIKCEQAEVGLELERLARTFRLHITSRCGGQRDQTRLSGRWKLQGAEQVELMFPNAQGPDEAILCRMETCTAGQDCLRCGVDSDLQFTLEPVRR